MSFLLINNIDADSSDEEVVVLVVVVLVAVVEVLVPGRGVRGLRCVALSTSPRRRLAPISGETAPDPAWPWPAVSVMRVSLPS